MIKDKLNALKEHILNQNEYFNKGFGYAYLDEDANIMASTPKGFVKVFPNDTLGNYFFFSVADSINIKAGQSMSDCGNKAYNDSLQVILVAVVEDADELQLMYNLRHSISSFNNGFYTTKANVTRESVVSNLLKGMPKEDITRALNNLGNKTIVSITIDLQYTIINNCITNPCKSC